MQKSKRLISFILALVMLVGALAPITAYAAEGDGTTPEGGTQEPHKTTVVLHKMKLDNLEGFPSTTGKDGAKYDGTDITKLMNGENNVTLESFFGEGAVELAGVKFYVYKINDVKDGETITESAESIYNTLVKNPKSYATKEQVEALAEKVTLVKEVVTAEGGVEITDLEDGYYWLVEDKGSLVDGGSLTDEAAVPFGLYLPMYMADGTVFDNADNKLHVYPKNTVDKPEIDKNFAKAGEGETELEPAEGWPEADKGAGIGVGADYDNYQKKKATAEAEIGKVIPYEVKTKIPVQTKWAQAYWDDTMTEGLTFNQDSLTITLNKIIPPTEVDGNPTYEKIDLVENTDYTIEKRDNGFKLSFTEAGLEKLNNKDFEQEVILTYSATVNSSAIDDMPEANDITFHYGNNKGHGNTPIPNKPSNGELTVTKTWTEGASLVAVEFTLYNAQTGKKVEASDVQTVDGYTFANPVTIQVGETMTYTWKGLDNDTEYKVVEKVIKGYSAEYGIDGAGQITVKNHKDDNPAPLNPTEPKVVTGGKKFVKTNDRKATETELERLAGAEFYIYKMEGEAKKYLALKADAEGQTDKQNYENAEADYKGLIKAWNKAVEDNKKLETPVGDEAIFIEYTFTGKTDAETFTGKKAVETKLVALKQARDQAFLNARDNYVWLDETEDKTAPADALVLTSDDQGRFEISGLAYGKYYLEEKTAPVGYAKLTAPIEFTVGKGTYQGNDTELQYNKDNTDAGYGLQVINKKVTIPQTGGIGTVLFTVGGLALMGGATFALKRNKDEDEE